MQPGSVVNQGTRSEHCMQAVLRPASPAVLAAQGHEKLRVKTLLLVPRVLTDGNMPLKVVMLKGSTMPEGWPATDRHLSFNMKCWLAAKMLLTWQAHSDAQVSQFGNV